MYIFSLNYKRFHIYGHFHPPLTFHMYKVWPNLCSESNNCIEGPLQHHGGSKKCTSIDRCNNDNQNYLLLHSPTLIFIKRALLEVKETLHKMATHLCNFVFTFNWTVKVVSNAVLSGPVLSNFNNEESTSAQSQQDNPTNKNTIMPPHFPPRVESQVTLLT